MKKFICKVWAKFLTMFGNIKVFRFPMFMVYDPSEYAMDGPHLRAAIESLKPGDVVLRGYDSYLDGYFIDDPLSYSHGAVYIGDSTIVHAVAEGVSRIDAVDFMRCDRICILRPAGGQETAIDRAKKFAEDNVPYDFMFSTGSNALYCFELVAECYKELSIRKCEVKKLFGLVTKHAYLANSFRQSKDFKLVFEWNKKFNIDFKSKEKDK